MTADSTSPVPPPLAEPLSVAEPPALAETRRDQPPLAWREILAVLALVALSDVTIYRGQGFAGYALLFVLAPVLLLAGAFRPRLGQSVWIVALMLALLAAKMVWCGSELLVVVGFVLVVAFAMAIWGLCPYVVEVVVFASQTVMAGYEGLIHYGRSVNKAGTAIARAPAIVRGSWLSVVLPLAALVVFSLLFVLANPDLVTILGQRVDAMLDALRRWIHDFAPSVKDVLFWIAVVWVAVGLLRPVLGRAIFAEASSGPDTPSGRPESLSPAPLYAAFRNTLATLIALFAVYLAFEFSTLWFRVFPEGFYYSGYAHEGAAWLTVALALATGTLSLVFRGRVLGDPRLPKLRKLAWIWSLENMLLALAVYNRLSIYIGFNGMTRMRIVGLFGMSAVVVGFVLVLRKIACGRDFVWLMRRHLWTLALAIYLFALTPVDTIVVGYNVRRILSGDPAPSVQISVHPISAEGVLLLQPLLDCSNPTIREGIGAMLAKRHEQAEALARLRRQKGWTTFQFADLLVLDNLRAARHNWAQYEDRGQRAAVLKRFHDYAYQWY